MPRLAARVPHPDAPLIEIELLQLFDLLYETHSVTASAQRLGLSQPTMSIRLAKLRDRLRDPLFVRTPDGMQPTPRADTLIGATREAIAAMRRIAADEAPFDPAASSRRFRICMTDASHITLLPRLLEHVRARAPGASLEAKRIDEHTAAMLQSGAADLVLGYVPWLDSGFYQQALYTQDWVCLVAADHPRIGRVLDLQRYREAGHIGIAGGTGTELLDEAFVLARLERRIVLELPGFLGLAAIVSTTDLVATLPRMIGETLARAGGLAVHPAPGWTGPTLVHVLLARLSGLSGVGGVAGSPQGCGDKICSPQIGETCNTCPQDCGQCPPGCGDGSCTPMIGETCNTCPQDCGPCGGCTHDECTVGTALVVNVPGSPKGAVECLEAVVDVVPHAVALLADERPH